MVLKFELALVNTKGKKEQEIQKHEAKTDSAPLGSFLHKSSYLNEKIGRN